MCHLTLSAPSVALCWNQMTQSLGNPIPGNTLRRQDKTLLPGAPTNISERCRQRPRPPPLFGLGTYSLWCSHRTLPHFSLQDAPLNMCYYHQDQDYYTRGHFLHHGLRCNRMLVCTWWCFSGWNCFRFFALSLIS